MKSSWDYTQELVSYVTEEQPSIQAAMDHAADILAAHIQPRTAKLLRTYNYDKLETQLLAHLACVIRREPPPSTTIAFYLGLFDQSTGLLNKYEHQSMYICGTDRFATDDDGDWACGPAWFPNYRYFPRSFFKQLGKLEGLNDLQTGFLLSQTFAAAFALVAGPMLAKSVPTEKHPIPIACGHDAGYIFVVCYATPDEILKP